MNPKCKRHDKIRCAICYPFLINDRSVDDDFYSHPKPSLLRSSLPAEPRRTRFHISDSVYGGKRVWLEWDEPEHGSLESVNKAGLHAVLDNLSKWGGADKFEHGKYVCWEVDNQFIPNVKRALVRYLYVEDTSKNPEWLA